jgi:hypothetical protein
MHAIFENGNLLGYVEKPNYIKPHPRDAELGRVPCGFNTDCGLAFGDKSYSIAGNTELLNADGEVTIVPVDHGDVFTKLADELLNVQLALLELYEGGQSNA